MSEEDRRLGSHLIIDIWGAQNVSSELNLKNLFQEMAAAADAKILNIMLHRFPEPGGITGVAMLAESHMSVHTWPELDYAAFDIFMCGRSRPQQALEVLERVTKPKKILVSCFKRGVK